jgi:aminoglycoside 6'-N-acetyltransferase
MGEVTIRPVGAEDLERLDSWRNDPEHEGGFNSFLRLHNRRPVHREGWEKDGWLSEDEGRLIVELDGEPVGAVQYFPQLYGPNRGSQALVLGIAIAPEARGQGVGSRAQRLVADYLFAETLTNRVEASTDIENLAEQGALTKAGFTREGVLRGAQWRAGTWHDMVLFSRLRNDP